MDALGIDDTNFSPSKGMVSSELHTALATPRTDQGSVNPISFRKYVNVVNNALTTHAPRFVNPTGDNTIEWTFVEWKVPTEFRIERRSNSNENRLDTTPWVELVAKQTALSYEDTATNLEEFVEYRVTPVTAAGDGVPAIRAATLQDASITINGIEGPSRLPSGRTTELTLDMEGQWDTIRFDRSTSPLFFPGSGSTTDEGVISLFIRRSLPEEADYEVTYTAHVTGTGTNAKDGTSDSDSITFTLTLYPALNIDIHRTVVRDWMYFTDINPNRYLRQIDFFESVRNGTEPYTFEPVKNVIDPDDSSIDGWRRHGGNVNGGDVSLTVVVTDDSGDMASTTETVSYGALEDLSWSMELDGRIDWTYYADADDWLYAVDIVSADEEGGAPPYTFSPAKHVQTNAWRRFGANEDGGTITHTATMSDAGTMSLEKSISVTYPARFPPLMFSLAATGVGWGTYNSLYRYRASFAATISGGQTPYTYNPVKNFGALWARHGASLTGGTISLTVVATDDNDDTATATASFTYPAAPSLSFRLSASGVGWLVDSGNVVYRASFSGSASGGATPYSYSPARNFGNAWARHGSSRSGGTISLTVVATDANKRTGTASASYTYPALSTVSFSLSASGVGWLVDSGNVVYRASFSGSASGGLSPYSYSPTRNFGALWARHGASRTGGTISLTVVATDAASQTRSSTASYTYPALPALSFSLSASGVGWMFFSDVSSWLYRASFSGSASGGLSPYTYSPVRNFGTGWARHGANEAGGTISLTVVATDAAGQTRSSTASYTYPAR